MPIFTPYHRFYYSGGFTILSPRATRFKPSSGDSMVQFTPSSISNTAQPGVAPDMADISVGPQQLRDCFSFNFTKVDLGCDSKEAPCLFTFNGFKYDRLKQTVTKVTSQTSSVPACLEAMNCSLTPVSFSGFDDITSITVEAQADGEPVIWWADDFTFGWFEDSCESRVCRSTVPNSITKPSWSVTGRRAAMKIMSLVGIWR